MTRRACVFATWLIVLVVAWTIPQSRLPDVDSGSEYLVVQKLVDGKESGLRALFTGMRGPVHYEGWPIVGERASQVESKASLPHYDSHFGLQGGILAVEFSVLRPMLARVSSAATLAAGY